MGSLQSIHVLLLYHPMGNCQFHRTDWRVWVIVCPTRVHSIRVVEKCLYLYFLGQRRIERGNKRLVIIKKRRVQNINVYQQQTINLRPVKEYDILMFIPSMVPTTPFDDMRMVSPKYTVGTPVALSVLKASNGNICRCTVTLVVALVELLLT